MEGKINSAKSKLGTSFNKEAVRRVINKLVNDYLKILPTIVFPKVNDKGIIKYLSYNGI